MMAKIRGLRLFRVFHFISRRAAFLFFLLLHFFNKDTLAPDITPKEYAKKEAEIRKINMVRKIAERDQVVGAHDKCGYRGSQPTLFQYFEKPHFLQF